jgi:hypothetical protein
MSGISINPKNRKSPNLVSNNKLHKFKILEIDNKIKKTQAVNERYAD